MLCLILEELVSMMCAWSSVRSEQSSNLSTAHQVLSHIFPEAPPRIPGRELVQSNNMI